MYGQFRCSGCKDPLARYCSKQHQKYHWHNLHQKYCTSRKQKEAKKKQSDHKLATDKDQEAKDKLYSILKQHTFPIFEIVPGNEPLPITSEINGDRDGHADGVNGITKK